MARPVSVTDEQIAQALRSSGGVVSHAAEELGISRQQVGNRLRGNADLESARTEGRDQILDSGESGLFKAVRAEKPWAIRFVLSRLGRARGYGASLSLDTQHTGKVVVYLPDDGRELPEEATEAVERKGECEDEETN